MSRFVVRRSVQHQAKGSTSVVVYLPFETGSGVNEDLLEKLLEEERLFTLGGSLLGKRLKK